MTTLIQQISDSDCALASLAMFVGATSWYDVWTLEDLEPILGKGIGDTDEYLARLGYVRRRHFRNAYIHDLRDMESFCTLMWKRRALLSVHSLNTADGNHMIYWDGMRIWDPSPKRTYLHLRSAHVQRVTVFDEEAILEDGLQPMRGE